MYYEIHTAEGIEYAKTKDQAIDSAEYASMVYVPEIGKNVYVPAEIFAVWPNYDRMTEYREKVEYWTKPRGETRAFTQK